LVAVAFGETEGLALANRLRTFSRLLSANLLEAELRAVFARERLSFRPHLLAPIAWVLPDRPLAAEMSAALTAGYLRGADLWHVATALYVAPHPDQLVFVTLDDRQRTVAASLEFQT
jgi:hypothetical protein